ncbi:MAG: LacI family transcriptional regulator [Acidobacteriota bacterium]|jgi:LacI family transcriptional regulator|nr:LacI family transcriptional regulator [Acidobacteriota bacterium]
MKTKMRIKDVAREAGVSTATVSHVINNTRFVSEAMREKVLRAIELCNYYPNEHARSLASGRSSTLGLLISDISNPFFPELVKSIETVAFEKGYEVILANTDYNEERTLNNVKRFIERKVAGVALMTSELDQGLIHELARHHVPVVFLDIGSPGMCMSNIVVDYETGISEAISHLVWLGHRKIAYIGGPSRLRSAAKRLEAFRDSMAYHLPESLPLEIYEGDFRLEGGRRVVREMLGLSELPTAIVAANDMMALGVMQELRERGLHVPDDISIVGFDDIAFASLCHPLLTTVRLPRTELGRKAVEALMATIEHPERQGVEINIPTYFILRDSTAPPSGLAQKRDVNRQVAKYENTV